MYDLSGGRKMVAMSENGPIPDPDALFSQDAGWAWWSTWADLTFSQNDTQHIKDVFANPLVIDMDNLVAIEIIDSKSSLALKKSFTFRKVLGGISIVTDEKVIWKLYSLRGKLIKSGFSNFVALNDISAGVYNLKINNSFSSKVSVIK